MPRLGHKHGLRLGRGRATADMHQETELFQVTEQELRADYEVGEGFKKHPTVIGERAVPFLEEETGVLAPPGHRGAGGSVASKGWLRNACRPLRCAQASTRVEDKED